MSVRGRTQRETQSYTKSEGEHNDPVREGLRLEYTCDIYYYAPTILRSSSLWEFL